MTEFSLEAWNRVLHTNLTAQFLITKAALPDMRSAGWGRVINIASVHGLVASENKSAYVAAKHGLIGFTKVLALECANTGITANAVCPGWVLTPLVEAQVKARATSGGITFEQAKDQLLSEKQPQLRFASPEDIGGAVAYFCSPYAHNVTGTTLTVDGGWTAR